MKVAQKFVLLPIDRYNSLKKECRVEPETDQIIEEKGPPVESKPPESIESPAKITNTIKRSKKLTSRKRKVESVHELGHPINLPKPPPGIRQGKNSKKGTGKTKKTQEKGNILERIKWRSF
jgi:hypothetical protein